MSPDAPVIVTALFGDEDQAWFEALRRAHFPPERNRLAAHLTLFHHLPPSALAELHARLGEAARGPAPAATLAGVMKLGRGTAFAIRSEGLTAIRGALAQAFAGLLTPQDAGGWRPHVTVQNKVTPEAARVLHAALSAEFAPRPLRIAALATWFYRGGPWEPVRRFAFRQ